MSVSEGKATAFSKKYPIPEDPHFGCILKVREFVRFLNMRSVLMLSGY
jgi:hypothetical protein